MVRYLALLPILVLAVLSASSAILTASAGGTFVVNHLPDEPDANTDDGICDADLATEGEQCSIRAAMQQANASQGADTILLPAETLTLTRDGTDDNASEGDLDVTSDITVTGVSAGQTIVEAGSEPGGLDRVFHVRGNGDLNLTDLTVRHGDVNGRGGGIFNQGDLTLLRTTVSENMAQDGAGIFNEGGDVTITASTITLNHTAVDGGGIYNEAGSVTIDDTDVTFNLADENGAGVNSEVNGAVLVITNSRITDNEVTDDCCNGGGVISEFGTTTLTISDSTVARNVAAQNGGGIYTSGDVTLSITNTTIDSNEAGSVAGGLRLCCAGGTATIANSTISNNTAGLDAGGALVAADLVTITNSTISGNESLRHGGGIHTFGPLTTNFVTITGNVADADNAGPAGDGGGIWTESTVSINNTILAGNFDFQTPSDCFGTLTSADGHNLMQTLAGCTLGGDTTDNVTDLDPLLGPLAANGGDTQTHALTDGSPAIDAALDDTCPDTDQRAVARPVDGDGIDGPACDIGAFEVEPSQGDARIWGDWNCADGPNPVDSLLNLRHDAGLATNTGDCPDMGQTVDVQNASEHIWGDADCNGVADPVDSLKLLRFDAGLSVSQEEGCPEVGSEVIISVNG